MKFVSTALAGFLLCFSSLLFVDNTLAGDIPFEFDSAEQEQRFKQLAEELRCLVCQNQSLADSNAGLAQDLRNEVYEMLMAGNSNEAIVTYLVDRYGDFVLYRPPLKSTTYLLWFGPALFLGIGVLIAWLMLRKKPQREISEEEKRKAEQLLEENESEANKNS